MGGIYDAFDTIGLVTGIIGLVLYSISLVLMTRLRILESIFGGLNRVYIAHHITGGLSLVFMLIHPLGLVAARALSSVTDAALLLIPHKLVPFGALINPEHAMHSTILNEYAIFAGIIGLWLAIVLLVVTIFIKLPYRVWLISHKMMGVAYIFIGLHLLYIKSDTSVDPWLRWYLIAFFAIGLIAYVYKTVAGQILIRKHRYVVSHVVMLADGVVRLHLDSPAAHSLRYTPGQFVFMRFLDAKGLSREWHPFSISSCSGVDADLQLTIKYLGDYTSKLAFAKPGAAVEIEGAYGKFSYQNFKNRDQVWIAGGIGVTPFLSMVKQLPPEGYRVYLFYSVKTRSEIIDWALLYDQMMQKSNSLRVIPYIADEQPSFLNADYISQTVGGLEGRDYYLCGPPAMMESIKQQLKDSGVPAVAIHSEEFSMS